VGYIWINPWRSELGDRPISAQNGRIQVDNSQRQAMTS
jgi:hypothetical protein